MAIYCGNNNNFQGLIDNTHTIGSNYKCLRKGIGIGNNLPYDGTFAQPHEPIDDRKFYCGNDATSPPGYFALGSPSKCMQIGVGVGKAQRARLGPVLGFTNRKYIIPYLLFILLAGGLFTVLFFTKPDFISEKDVNGGRKIIWKKFIQYYVIFCLILVLLIWFGWKQSTR